MTEDFEFETLLRTYAEPVEDNGFTQAVLQRVAPSPLRRPIILGAALLGGALALSQVPSLYDLMSSFDLPAFEIPNYTPMAIMTIGLLGFVGWAALDRGWSDAV